MDLTEQVMRRFDSLYQQGITPWVRDDVPPEVIKFFTLVKANSNSTTPTLLDIGCGSGWLSLYFAEHGIRVKGIDSSLVAIQEAATLAKKQGVSIDFQVGNALDFPYGAHTFDAVFDRGLFHHLSEKEWARYIQGVERVLTTKGLLYLGVFSDESSKRGYSPKKTGQLEYRYTDERTGYESYDHFFNRDIIQKLFGKSFEIIDEASDAQSSGDGSLLLHFVMRARN